MPRPALATVSTAALQAEIERRTGKLVALIVQREKLDKEIAELQSLGGQVALMLAKPPYGLPVTAEAPSVKPVRKSRRRKAMVAKVTLPAAKQGQRGVFKETGEAMILRLLTEQPLTGSQLNAAWTKAGRGGRAANELTRLVKTGRVRRTPAPTGVGSVYSVAGGKAAVKAAAMPVITKPGKFNLTAPELILGLLTGGKVLTTKELAQAWKTAGRKGKVDKVVSVLVQAKKLTRRKITGGQGSTYSLAGSAGRPAKTAAAKPAGKKTFTCPTCKEVFASGPMLGTHYKTEPSHRRK